MTTVKTCAFCAQPVFDRRTGSVRRLDGSQVNYHVDCLDFAKPDYPQFRTLDALAVHLFSDLPDKQDIIAMFEGVKK